MLNINIPIQVGIALNVLSFYAGAFVGQIIGV
jgi:hypothetical protein